MALKQRHRLCPEEFRGRAGSDIKILEKIILVGLDLARSGRDSGMIFTTSYGSRTSPRLSHSDSHLQYLVYPRVALSLNLQAELETEHRPVRSGYCIRRDESGCRLVERT